MFHALQKPVHHRPSRLPWLAGRFAAGAVCWGMSVPPTACSNPRTNAHHANALPESIDRKDLDHTPGQGYNDTRRFDQLSTRRPAHAPCGAAHLCLQMAVSLILSRSPEKGRHCARTNAKVNAARTRCSVSTVRTNEPTIRTYSCCCSCPGRALVCTCATDARDPRSQIACASFLRLASRPLSTELPRVEFPEKRSKATSSSDGLASPLPPPPPPPREHPLQGGSQWNK